MGDIILLNMCTINDDHMMHGSCDMEQSTDLIFSHFGPVFTHLPTSQLEKMKKNTWRYYVTYVYLK